MILMLMLCIHPHNNIRITTKEAIMYLITVIQQAVTQLLLVCAHTGNHTFAALKVEEANIKSGMSEIVDAIKELITDPKLTVNGTPYELNILLGGDYKVVQLMLSPPS